MEMKNGYYLKRHSADFSNIRIRICSRYQKPRVGSCHDRCKSEIHDPFEVKPHIHLSRWSVSSQSIGQNPKYSMEEDDVQRLDSHFEIPSGKELTDSTQQTLQPSEKNGVSVHHRERPDPDPKITLSLLSSRGCVSTNRSSCFRTTRRAAKCSLALPQSLNTRRRSEFTMKRANTYPTQMTNVAAFLSSSPRFYIKWSSTLHANRCDYPETAYHIKNQVNSRENKDKQCSNDSTAKKTICTIEPTARDDITRSTEVDDINGYSSQSPPSSTKRTINKRNKIATRTDPVPASFRNKAPRHTQNGITALQSPSLKSSSSDKSNPRETQTGVSNNKTHSTLSSGKKILRRRHIELYKPRPSSLASQASIRISSRNNSTQNDSHRRQLSSSALSSSRTSSRSSSISPHKETNDALSELDGMEHKGKKRNITVVDLNRSPPRKLKFRSGKVIEPQVENCAPRKLKFRRGRVLKNPSGKGDARWRVLRKVIQHGLTDTYTDSMKTALRQQNIGGNKVPESLLNEVIKETASKLVETRKSKVKALVGAFETVISLQD